MRPTVAIVDPDANLQRQLRGLLGSVDANVLAYNSAEQFLAQRPTVPVACVIAECVLPGMSGLQFLTKLRAGDADLPVILLAAEPDIPTAVAAMRLGATDFIEKPQLDVALPQRMSQLLRNNG